MKTPPRVIVETARLRLRELRFADADFIVELLNDAGFLRFIGDRGVRSREDAREYLRSGPLASYEQHGFGLWMVELREEVTPIGMCGLLQRPTLEHPDIGFAYLAEFRRQGYGREAAEATLRHACDDLNINRVVAVTQSDNVGSVGLLRSLGMQREGTTRIDEESAEIELYGICFDDRPESDGAVEAR